MKFNEDDLLLRNEILRGGVGGAHGVLIVDQANALIIALDEEHQAGSLRRCGEVFAVRNLLAVSAEVRKLAASSVVLGLAGEIPGTLTLE